jgi:hypothetical protein
MIVYGLLIKYEKKSQKFSGIQRKTLDPGAGRDPASFVVLSADVYPLILK